MFSNMSVGLIFVLAGIIILMLSLTLSLPPSLWAIAIGTSIIVNVLGTAITMRFVRKLQ